MEHPMPRALYLRPHRHTMVAWGTTDWHGGFIDETLWFICGDCGGWYKPPAHAQRWFRRGAEWARMTDAGDTRAPLEAEARHV